MSAQRSRRGRDLLSKGASLLFGFIENKTDAELRAMQRAVRKLNTTNCGWTTYELRASYKELIAVARENRRIHKRNARREKKRGNA